MLQNMIGSVCHNASKLSTSRADTSFRRQKAIVHLGYLLVLSFTILQGYCQYPRWSKPQAVYCYVNWRIWSFLFQNSCRLWYQQVITRIVKLLPAVR